MWARRILESAMGIRALEAGYPTQADLEAISAGWTRWSEHPDGVFVIPRGAILCRV